MATTLTKNYQKIATITLTYGKIYTYAKYTEQTVSGGKVKTTYKIKSEYDLNQYISFSSATAKLDGTSKTYGYTTLNAGTTILQELTRTITHNTDGTSPTKSISTSWSATFGGSGSSSGSIKAPTKKVIATMVSATDFNDEGNPTITFNNPSSYYVRPYLNFYNSNNVRVHRIYGTIEKHSSPYTWSLTSEQRDALRTATNSQKTYKVAEGIQTFTSSAETSLIEDSADSIDKTFSYVNAEPYITFTTIQETNQKVVDLLGSNARTIIPNVSKIYVSVTPTAYKNATISKVVISGVINGEISTSPYELEQNVGDVTQGKIQATAIDSRGYESEVRAIPTILDYQPVKQNSFSFKRLNPTSADVILELDSVYYQRTIGSTPNAPTVKYKIGNTGTWITIPDTEYDIDTETNTLSLNYTIEDAISYTSSDTFYVEVSDLLTSWANQNVITKGIPVMEWGDDEVQINGDLLLADTDRDNVINVRDALGGGGGTTDYSLLSNKPQINNVTLSGNKSLSDLGINIPTQTSQLTNNSGFITNTVNNLTNYTKTTDLGAVATSNDYDDLDNKPTIKDTTNTNSQYNIGWYGDGASIISDINNSSYLTPNEYTFTLESTTSNIPSDLVSLLSTNEIAILKTYSTSRTTNAFTGLRQELYVPRLTDKYWYRHIKGTSGTATFGNWYEVATTDDIPTIPTNYVTTDTTQDITSAKTFKEVVKVQNGQGTGAMWIGGDVNANTLSNNTRHLARISVPSYSDVTLATTLLGYDSSGDTNMNVTNKGSDVVSFGGMKKITNATSPMAIGFCVANTRNGTTANQKVYPLEMDSNEARFNVQPNYNGTNLATVDYHDSTKQDALVSGTNIKTINNTSLLGSGNITIGGGGTATDVKINGTSITSGGEADIITEGTYNSSTNKIATMSDIPSDVSELNNDAGYITASDIPTPTVLYSNTTGSVTNITLNDSVSNYSYLEIFYGWETNSFGTQSTRYDMAMNGNINLTTTVLNNNYIYWASSEWTPTGNKINLSKGEYWRGRVATQSAFTRTQDNKVAIYKVLGYK